MKFSEIQYERPNVEVVAKNFEVLIDKFKGATSAEEQSQLIDEINTLRSNFETQWEVAGIRHTINTEDKFYEDEQAYYDENGPLYQEAVTNYYRALVASSFKENLIEKFGDQLFVMAELSTKVFEPEIIKDVQEENRLSTEYNKLIASAQIEFDGKTLNLSGLDPYTESQDREMRIKANEAKWGFFAANQDKLDDLYDKLVKVRHGMAKKLGYNNYIEMGYARMLRSDYNADMVANYRKQVLENVVPVAQKLRDGQRKRLGYDSLKHYDFPLYFNDGNPEPKGNPDWIIENGKKMYNELSDETDEFFNFMLDNELMDLVNKKGKASGGYCTMMTDYKAPFIFSNFNGTSGDIDVLTHEAGHAFQVYESRNLSVMEYYWPTYEACEIHSMSMEFFTWPWMGLFFKEDTSKYKYGHLSNSMLFLPYGVSVDEFQHEVYANPDMTPAERRAKWREIEKKYTPSKDYDGNEYLENGGYWQKQGHIFQSPFYYIDYTLAQVCAFQFWIKMQNNYKGAWKDYLTLCKAGGTKAFLGLVDLAGLESPFKDGVLKDVVQVIEAKLQELEADI